MIVIEYFKQCFTDIISLLGLIASILTLVSLCFNSKATVGSILMRIFNLLGNIIYVIYSCLLGPSGFGMLVLNIVLIFINIYYLIKNIKEKKGNN